MARSMTSLMSIGSSLYFLASRLRFGIKQNFFDHVRQPAGFFLNDSGILLDAFFILNDAAAKIVRSRADDRQWRTQFV